MKFTLSWLLEHLETDVPLARLAETLSAIGLEVESVEDPGEKLKAFTIARVLSAQPHPNADRLKIVQVETAKGAPPIEVVCGAPNARAGLVGVFAPIGAFIPGTGITLEKRPVRGIVSNGMLVSERELELSDAHEGIIELPEDFAARVGERYADVVGLADPVIEVKLTPNRADCTGVRGIARDLAAAGLGALKPEPALEGVEGAYDCPIAIELEFPEEAANACPIFAGRLVRGVHNGPSPAKLANRLKAVGLRPINALVDVTNYISLDRGRPLHVYDASKLAGTVRARLGRDGERFLGLDGKEHTIDTTMCVIADDNGPLGLGGVMGGAASGCTEETRDVFIESALFDPIRTAATGRRTGLMTDARYRFERGVDPASVLPGLDLATRMILDLAGGTPSRARIVGKAPESRRTIAFDPGRVARLTGLALDPARIRPLLTSIGCEVSGRGAKLKVTPPSWRPDLHGAADLVEEAVRLTGLDQVPATPLPRPEGIPRPVLTLRQQRQRRARRLLAARGLVEAITWSFIPRAHARLFGGGQPELELANPISADMTVMRPGLLPGLLAAAQRNRNRGASSQALFELGQAYHGDQPEDQYAAAAGVRTGTAGLLGSGRHWDGAAAPVDVFSVKADALALLAALGLDPAKIQAVHGAPPWYHPGRAGILRLGPKTILAHFGELHPETLRALDLAAPAAAFEVFLDALPPEKKKSRVRPPLPEADLLPVRRDFAFILDKDVPAAQVAAAVLSADRTLIADVTVFDLFEGGNLAGEGRKSLAIEAVLQPAAATLTDKDIEAVSAKIIAAVRAATGGEIRS